MHNRILEDWYQTITEQDHVFTAVHVQSHTTAGSTLYAYLHPIHFALLDTTHKSFCINNTAKQHWSASVVELDQKGLQSSLKRGTKVYSIATLTFPSTFQIQL